MNFYYIKKILSALYDRFKNPERKGLYISAALLLFLVIIFVVSAQLNNPKVNKSPVPPIAPTQPLPVPPEVPPEELTNPTAVDEAIPQDILDKFPVEAQNKVADAVLAGKEINSLDRILFESSSYSIVHYFRMDVFTISIFNSNFAKTRTQAEQKFVALLGVDQKIICNNLTVEIVAPQTKDSSLLDKKFPLSFCK